MLMRVCDSEHMCMHVVAECTEATPVLDWHGLNNISMLDLTLLSVCLLPLTHGGPVCCGLDALTAIRQHTDQDKWNYSLGYNEDVLLKRGHARRRDRGKGKEREGREERVVEK